MSRRVDSVAVAEFCRQRLSKVMAALNEDPSLSLAQEAVLLASVLQLDPDPSAFVRMLQQLARDQNRRHLAESAGRILLAWQDRFAPPPG